MLGSVSFFVFAIRFWTKFFKRKRARNSGFKHNLPLKPQSFYLTKSQAIFKIGYVLGGRYRLLSYLKYFPQFLTDFVYSQVAANRHRLAPDHCTVLSPDQRKKFIFNND
ncbi:DCC1-like thiol-disulfide oxidoreductase family protein [Kaistella anthropi]|nr:DCC1-like thiol-disulfide oxidoreductase family protein [Kaistella anthropi]